MRKRVLEEKYLNMLTSIANLASIYKNQRWKKEAKELFVQVIEKKKRILEEEYPDMLISNTNIALT